jgi:hypothetical protein
MPAQHSSQAPTDSKYLNAGGYIGPAEERRPANAGVINNQYRSQNQNEVDQVETNRNNFVLPPVSELM